MGQTSLRDQSYPGIATTSLQPRPGRAWRLCELGAFLRAGEASFIRRPACAAIGGYRGRVGVNCYTWLEQGRDIRLSRRAASPLPCGWRRPTEAYLFRLAGLPRAPPPAFCNVTAPHVQPILDSHATPAAALDAGLDLVTMNAIARDLYRIETSRLS